MCATVSASAPRARSRPPSTWRARWRSAPTGATRRAASCSRSAASSRCRAIPTGVPTQDPTRARALVVPHKVERVYNYHHATLHALAELVAAAGLEHPQDLRAIHFSQRSSTTEVKSFAKLYPALRPGELIDGTSDSRFREAWAMARADSFAPAG